MLESLFNKVAGFQTPAQVFSCEQRCFPKNTYFEKHLNSCFCFKGNFPRKGLLRENCSLTFENKTYFFFEFFFKNFSSL